MFVPHNGYQDGGEGPGERCSECVGVEGTVRGQYAGESPLTRITTSPLEMIKHLTHHSRDLRPPTPLTRSPPRPCMSFSSLQRGSQQDVFNHRSRSP